MFLTYLESKKLFLFKCNYSEKGIPKDAGFIYDANSKLWYTRDELKALKLKAYATDNCKLVLQSKQHKIKKLVEESSSADSDFNVPKPDNGMDYFGFQRSGIKYMSDKPVVFLFDDMGVGKTIQAIGVTNLDKDVKRGLIVCPNSVKTKWKEEWKSWSIHDKLSVSISNGGEINIADVMICNFEMFSKSPKKSGYNPTKTILKLIKKVGKLDFIIIDEAHRIKNWNAQTTRSLFSLRNKTNRLMMLTGSPVLNKPDDIWMFLRFADLHLKFAPDKTTFQSKFCGYELDKYNRMVINYDKIDEDKLYELQIKLRTMLLLRRTKSQVLKDLKKIRSAIPIDIDDIYKNDFNIAKSLQTSLEKLNESNNLGDSILKGLKPENIEELTRLRKLTGIAKVKNTVEFVKDILATGEKVLLFCHHHDVIDKYKKHFPNHIEISGKISIEQRDLNQKKFQKDPTCKVAILQMDSAGVGIDLTAGSNVVFAEYHWIPKIMEQCEDRSCRNGQTKMVNIYYMVADGTIDAMMVQMILNKIKISTPLTELTDEAKEKYLS